MIQPPLRDARLIPMVLGAGYQQHLGLGELTPLDQGSRFVGPEYVLGMDRRGPLRDCCDSMSSAVQ